MVDPALGLRLACRRKKGDVEGAAYYRWRFNHICRGQAMLDTSWIISLRGSCPLNTIHMQLLPDKRKYSLIAREISRYSCKH